MTQRGKALATKLVTSLHPPQKLSGGQRKATFTSCPLAFIFVPLHIRAYVCMCIKSYDLFVCVNILLLACVCTTRVPGAHRGQEEASDNLELEL